jgi:hypothetical protein
MEADMKTSLLATLVVAASAVALQPSFPAPTTQPGFALGTIKFSTPTVNAKAVFRVQKTVNGTVSGRFTYEDRGGVGNFSQFSMNVDGAIFIGNSAVLTGRPAFASEKWRNKRIVVHLFDGGFTTGVGDFIAIKTTAIDASAGAVLKLSTTQTFYPRLGGNFTVRGGPPFIFPIPTPFP